MGENTRYDLDNYELISKALWDLMNDYPDLGSTAITFAQIDEEKGITFMPISGAVILSEQTDITGHTVQECIYPFQIIRKASGLSERAKLNAKEWLDTLGKWLERQPIVIGNNGYQLTEYPTLTGDKEIKKIERTQPAYLQTVSDSNVETWVISLQATYRNEFDR